jgi:hypothetical protein
LKNRQEEARVIALESNRKKAFFIVAVMAKNLIGYAI